MIWTIWFLQEVKKKAIVLLTLSLLLYSGHQLRKISMRLDHFGGKVAETHTPHIHLALVVTGHQHTVQFFTLLKSILHSQGRHNQSSLACKLRVDTVTNDHCPSNQPPPYNPLQLHLLIDAQSRATISSFFHQNNISGLISHYYNHYDYPQIKELESLMPARLPLSKKQILKIIWPQILPDEVKKVIVMDTDLLFNQNVRHLWDIFEGFDDHQMIGGAFEMTDNLQRTMATPEYPILETGINTGVLLLHLERMRKSSWTMDSFELTKKIAKSRRGLRYSDQDIYNTFLYNNKHYFYQLPCHWNAVIGFGKIVRNCPLAWIIYDVTKADCVTRPVGTNLPGLLHICTLKPERLLNRAFKNPNPVKVARTFSKKELHDTFFEVYYAFRNLSMRCFR